jgi:tyrosyl-tRNA synthetase
MPLLVGLDGVDKMSKSKGNYIGITEPANQMFAKILSVSDDLMWMYYNLLSFQSIQEIEFLKSEIAQGKNPKDAKVALAKEIVTRFHSFDAAEKAYEDFQLRAKGGIPDDIPEVDLNGAPVGIAQLLKMTQLAPSTSEANRNIDQGGVKIDGTVISDRSLQINEGTFVLQVGKRKFVKVNLKK